MPYTFLCLNCAPERIYHITCKNALPTSRPESTKGFRCWSHRGLGTLPIFQRCVLVNRSRRLHKRLISGRCSQQHQECADTFSNLQTSACVSGHPGSIMIHGVLCCTRHGQIHHKSTMLCPSELPIDLRASTQDSLQTSIQKITSTNEDRP